MPDAISPCESRNLHLVAEKHAGGIHMNDANQRQTVGTGLLGLSLALGLILGGWVLGAQIKATRLGDRYVSVRGLAERNVKSNLAIWPIEYTETGDDLSSLYSKTEADRKVILQFLKQQGIQPTEIELGVPDVEDTQANRFGGANKPTHRYIVEQEITVQTPRVDQVAAAAQRTVTLLQQGIVLTSSPNQALTYKFTELNSIKPDMITEATRNARAAADRFALDSGSEVGHIRQASQGIFSILPANSGGDTGEQSDEGGFNSNVGSSIMKTVRIVTSVEYYLEK